MQKLPNLYPWQKEAHQEWINHDCTGIINACTGAGKTRLAIECIKTALKSEVEKVVVLVHRKRLQQQFYDKIIECVEYLNLHEEQVCMLGGGHREMNDSVRICVVIRDTARKLDADLLRQVTGDSVFLIVDECHNYGDTTEDIFRAFLETPHFTLGLSATPFRQYDTAFERIVKRELGPIIYQYTFKQAVKDKVISPLRVVVTALDLDASAAEEYERLSYIITDTRRRLSKAIGESVATLSNTIKFNELKKRYGQYTDIMTLFERIERKIYERKRLLYEQEKRLRVAERILEINTGKTMIFHEETSLADDLVVRLRALGEQVWVYHSNDDNPTSISEFEDSDNGILVSVKMLSEGYDHPEVKTAILTATMASARSIVQTIGRVMRRAESKDYAAVFILIFMNTADERVLKSVNFEDLGAELVQYRGEQLEKMASEDIQRLKSLSPKSEEVLTNEFAHLKPGEKYDYGKEQTDKYSFNHMGSLFVTSVKHGIEVEIENKVKQELFRRVAFAWNEHKFKCNENCPGRDRKGYHGGNVSVNSRDHVTCFCSVGEQRFFVCTYKGLFEYLRVAERF